jgi:hypothetical protein
MIGASKPIVITNSPFIGNRASASAKYDAGGQIGGGGYGVSQAAKWLWNRVTPGGVSAGGGQTSGTPSMPANNLLPAIGSPLSNRNNQSKNGLGGVLNGTFGTISSNLAGSVGSAVNNIVDYAFNATYNYSTQTTEATSTGNQGSGGGINLTPSLTASPSSGGGMPIISTGVWIAIIGIILGLVYFLKKK